MPLLGSRRKNILFVGKKCAVTSSRVTLRHDFEPPIS
jgi:hypothetical protein